jgi:mRNA-degrading endonuclease RelE of RelBE toxin-antitoxin system
MPQIVAFSAEARADLRAIDRETALRLLKALARFLETNAGSVKQLEGFDPPQYRLRIGDWRLIFRKSGDGAIESARQESRAP